MRKLNELTGFLRTLPIGAVEDEEQKQTLVSLLASVWDEIPGTDEEATHAYKLNRMEEIEWDGRWLEFTLERHGPTVQGSTRANLHRWRVGLDPLGASFTDAGFRTVGPISPRWNPDEIVSELSLAILNGKEHPNVKWINDGKFKIIEVKHLVPGDNKQTLANRRFRFRGRFGV